jgi:Spy/CpxP family protein refolding chaperone
MSLLPAMVAGGILFGAAFGHASSGDDYAPGDDAEHRAPPRRTADARLPPLPPAPPAPPVSPVPPVPPVPPGGWGQRPPVPVPGGRFTITSRNGKIHIDGLEHLVRHHLDMARDAIRNNPNMPPDVRDRALARLDRARAIMERRLASMSTADAEQLGEEMERMGDELEKALEGLDDDLEKLGDKLGKDLARKLGRDLARGITPKIRFDRHRGGDDDDDRADADADDDDGDDADHGGHDRVVVIGPDADAGVRGAIPGLPGLTLRSTQREQIVRLRSSYEQQIATARAQLEDASRRLEVALGDPRTSDADIARYVDQVSSHEATIRKARLLTWVNARRLLDDSQRKKIEDAAEKRRK